MKKNISKRILSLVLVMAMMLSFVPPVQATHEHDHADSESLAFEQLEEALDLELVSQQAEEEETATYADSDIVRVSIVMEEESVLEEGYSTFEIAENDSAMSYRDSLKQTQADVTDSIELTIGAELDVKRNLTLAVNIISANVEYGMIDEILSVDGVADVIIENRYDPAVLEQGEEYDPNMATSGQQIGSTVAWSNGYTGAGSRIAVIDTGIDSDHQSFSAAGFEYSLSQLAAKEEMDVDAYIESLNLLDAEEITSKLDQLNVGGAFTADQLYVNSKIAFGYNYIDEDVDIVHDNDTQGSHGSHVSGIATANTYIPNGDGTFANALNKVYVQGVAPDAQLITMKVFGKAGGAYDSDYMAAIEDAIVLGADSINLSLGSASNGFVTSNGYEEIMDSLTKSGTVVTISAGNVGNWAQYALNGTAKLYADDISFWTGGSPGSFTNSLGIASVQNSGQTGYYFTVGEQNVFYNETDYSNEPLATLNGEHEYIFIDGVGSEEDWAAVGDALKGKVAFCSRGTTSFFQKGIAAVEAGAIATIIYNNQDGTINMDLTDYTKTAPCVSITQAEGAAVKAASTPVTDDEGNVLYYTGKITINGKVSSSAGSGNTYTMSSFSSWGVPSALIMKPEITTPGGNIYSVNGVDKSGTAYENNSGTSMAAPQAAGMAAIVAQYIRENELDVETGLSVRQLAQSLLMSTAVPIIEKASGSYYSILNQGSGLANVGNAVTANSYILMDSDATASYADGKVKAELGDDAERTGEYSFTFTLNSLGDQDRTYTLGSDFFTQDVVNIDGINYLDTKTTPVAARVTYLVDGVSFTPVSKVGCDLDLDGDTDADDAQIILNYCAGIVTEIDKIADVNGDNAITTYDAYLILSSLGTSEITVPAGTSVEIEVKITLSDAIKASLDAKYVNGAYIEGFVSVIPTATAEGEILDVTHSIPVLGFYGSWTDASMYDKSDYVQRLYGDTTPTYLNVNATNALTVKYEGDTGTYYMSGNPYIVEEEYPAERISINTSAKLNNYKVSLIRNAAALATFIQNEDGELLYVSSPSVNVFGAYYSTSSAAWAATQATATIGRSLNKFDVQEGERVTVGVVAIPEYYAMEGALTAEDVAVLIDSGVLGEGAYLTTSMLVDDTAPVVDDISKSLINDKITITATDNNYIAAVMVTNKSGSVVFAEALPEQTDKNETVELTLDLAGQNLGSKYVVTVADYAGNKTSYQVSSNAPEEDYTGQMFVWTRNSKRMTEEEKASGLSYYRWMKVDPDTLWFNTTDNTYTGTENLFAGNYTNDIVNPASVNSHYLLAADYVEGFVVFALQDGNIYSAPISDLGEVTYMGNWSDVITAQGGSTVHALHLNYADGYMYLLDDAENFYRFNVHTCELEYVFTVTLFNPNTTSEAYNELYDFAIHKDGTFYALNKGAFSKCFYLYKFTLDQIQEYDNEDGTKFVGIQDLEPVFNDKNSHLGFSGAWNPTQMAWDHDKEILYMVRNTSTNISGHANSKLYTINLETGLAELANDYYPDGQDGVGASSTFYNYVYGLFIVPSESGYLLPGNQAVSVEVSAPRSEVLVNAKMQFSADVGPWNLEDKSVTWTSSDESVATIDEEGVATFHKVGSVTITATSVAKPHVEGTYDVTVVTYPSSILTAAVTGMDGVTHIAEFNTDDLTNITNITDATPNFLAGGLHMGKVYYHDGDHMYSVDAENQKITDLGVLASSWQWSDAASAPQYGLDLYNILIGLSNGGMFIELITPEDGTLRYFDLSSNETFSADPFSTICYVGEYADASKPGYSYYVIRESGKIAKLSIYTEAEGANFTAGVSKDRDSYDTGIDLSGVPTMGSGSYASSFYDPATGYVLVTQTAAGERTNLYAVDPTNGVTALLGTFGEDIELVNGLYMWDRARDTTVRLDVETLDLYTDETYDLTATVLPEGTSQNVTFASSDESIVTVDANGVVTPVAAGTATVTATSEALTADGVPATDTVTVNVKPLTTAAVTFTAQITGEDGSIYWGEVNTADMSVTKISDAPNPITAGGYHDGKIYGTDGDFVSGGNVWEIDPANGYTGSKGAKYSSSYVYVDGASAPTMKIAGTDGLVETCDLSINLSNSGVVILVSDHKSTSLTGFNLATTQRGATAIALVGEMVFKPISTSRYLAYDYFILENDGDLHYMVIYPKVDKSTGAVSYSQRFYKSVANIGHILPEKGEASMLYVENDGTKGLLVSYSGNDKGELYFIDVTAYFTADETDTITASKVGTLPGVTDLAAIHIPVVEGDEAPLDPSGKMYTWAYQSSYRLSEKEKTLGIKARWMEVDADTLWFDTSSASGYAYTGTTNVAATNYNEGTGNVLASEYVKGNAIFAHSDGYLYSAPMTDLTNATQLLYWKDYMSTVNDMALNYQDGYLYLLSGNGVFCKYNVSTNKLSIDFSVSTVCPNSTSASYEYPTAFAINDEGTFYAVNYGGTAAKYMYLYSWTTSDIQETTTPRGEVIRSINNLNPINTSKTDGYTGVLAKAPAQMTWDHDNDILYIMGNSTATTTGNNGYKNTSILYTLDTTTGKATVCNTYVPEGYEDSETGVSGLMYIYVKGLFVVPADGGYNVPTPTDPPVSGGDEAVDPAGQLLGFSTDATYRLSMTDKSRGAAKRWMAIDASTVWIDTSDTSYFTGTETYDVVTYNNVRAADYVNGTVYTFNNDYYIYSAPMTDLENRTKLIKWSDAMGTKTSSDYNVVDVAYNEVDGYLYALSNKNGIYKYDIANNTLTLDHTVTVINPTGGSTAFRGLTIDDDGNFYAVTSALRAGGQFLYKWSAADVKELTNEDGTTYRGIVDLVPVNNTTEGHTNTLKGVYSPSQLAWNSDTDVLYMFGGTKTWAGSACSQAVLYTVDTTTGLATVCSSYVPEGYEDGTSGLLYNNVTGLFHVPASYTAAPEAVQEPVAETLNDDTAVTFHVTEEPAFVPGTADTASSVVSVSTDVSELNAEPANQVNGSTNAAVAVYTADVENDTNKVPANSFIYELTEPVDVTNGKIVMKYDPTVLSFGGCWRAPASYAVNVDEAEGTVTLTFATTNVIEAGESIAQISFNVINTEPDCLYTTISFQTVERNDQVLNAEPEVDEIKVGVHTYEVVETVGDVCTEGGYVVYKCAVCGHSYREEFSGEGHKYDKTTVEATCTEGGYDLYTCSVCGDSYKDNEVPALNHSYGKTTVEATCTEGGYDLYTCANCGDSYTDNEVPAKGHSYTETVTEPTCTEMGYTTYTCANCGDSYKDNYVNPTGHKYEKTVTDPTCDTYGYTSYTCECGSSYNSDFVPALGHSYGDWEVVTTGSCTEEGQEKRTCSVCGEVEYRAIAGSGHDYKTEVTAPTCTEQGYTTYTCSKCGDSYTADYVDALGHDYETKVTAPTCTEMGYTTYTCAVCGESYVGDYVNPTGHTYTKKVTEPTCTEAGYTTYTCECGDSYVSDYVEATGHSFGEWVTVTEATCETKGQLKRTCQCGETEYRDTDATGHSYQAVVTEPTCTEQGYTTYTCECGASYVSDIVAATGHSFGEWVTVTEATCETKGQLKRTCQCGEAEYQDVDALGHSYETVVTAPTCTELGYTTYTCSVCGDNYVSDYVAALGHSYETVVTAPTCTELGYTTYTCHCGDSYVSDYVAPTGHTYGDWETVTEATCETKGQQKRTCQCGETEYRDTDALGHSYEAVVTEPTCTDSGYTTYTCSVCGDSYLEDLTAPVGHTYESVVTAPTCTELGYTTYTCSVCGDSYKADFVGALGHSFGEWVVTEEPDCFTDGLKVRTCDCGETESEVLAANSDNCPCNAYTDLDNKRWYHEGVDYVLNNGLMNGMTATEFAPDGTLTRAQLVTILYRLAGEPSVEGLNEPFTDVAEGRFYTDAITWAFNAGVIKGVSETAFAPEAPVTRQQIATILFRYTGAEKVEEDMLSAYTDGDTVGNSAKDAMNWAVATGLITGETADTLNPLGNATRAQIATILLRLSRLS